MLDIEICQQALRWRDDGHRVAVAVVLQTWGSAPRPVGARLFVRDDGAFIGSVSGGCIEGAVITTASDILDGGTAQRLSFGVADETAWEVGLSCGGEIAVFVQALDDNAAACLTAALQALTQRTATVLFTRTDTTNVDADTGNLQTLIDSNGELLAGTAENNHNITALLTAGATETDGVFMEPLAPPPRLLIVGATHITQSLLPMARQLAFDRIVIDPRARWATPERFPDTDLRCAWPDDALTQLGIGSHDAVITLTHDPKIDDPALLAALAAQPFYIGALGSRRTHDKRIARLGDAGVAAAELSARVHAPIGLDIGAKTAAEIALSIIAQVLLALRKSPQSPKTVQNRHCETAVKQ